ncbi:hypothetical protein CY34DRAFT_111168 [Suillus luteus UH-Slu-Lm8-n1]|uniref:Uncharacterized protein n=1 Tax=Suillus luteus UH-Slu-Lm8-n1 TaxID=930992 RepID=A0A0C9ZRM3_9AGAM|nr:hypothetical protein CY34DRAFT_111168 [Suillus luteus UH-Slu-Lm8-n1]
MSRLEQEDIQTSHDANLFEDDDDMEDDMENAAKFQTTTQVNSLVRTTRMDKREASQMDIDGAPGQPPTGSDKKEKLKMVPDKHCIKEVDYSAELHAIVYSQTEEINHMRHEMEKEAQNLQQTHMSSMEEIRKQWEVALREQEVQLTKELSDKASRAEQHKQFEDYMRRGREAVCHANPEVDARKRYEQELVQREEEFSRKKEEEFLGHENVRFSEMEQRLKSEVDKLRAEKENELANMEQRFSRSYRFQDKDTEMDTSPRPSAKPLSGTQYLDTIKRLMKRISAARNMMISCAEVGGLPKALYNEGWLAGLTKRQVEMLAISEEQFKWMKLTVA